MAFESDWMLFHIAPDPFKFVTFVLLLLLSLREIGNNVCLVGFFHQTGMSQASFIRWMIVQTASITSWLQAIRSWPQIVQWQNCETVSCLKAWVNVKICEVHNIWRNLEICRGWEVSICVLWLLVIMRIPAPPSRTRTPNGRHWVSMIQSYHMDIKGHQKSKGPQRSRKRQLVSGRNAPHMQSLHQHMNDLWIYELSHPVTEESDLPTSKRHTKWRLSDRPWGMCVMASRARRDVADENTIVGTNA